MTKRSICCVFALFITLAAGLPAAHALDRIYAATGSYEGLRLIRVYAAGGQHLTDIPISEEYALARFVTGTWIPRQDYSVIALLLTKKGAIEARVLDKNGAAVKVFDLGKDVMQVISIDYDKNGVSDLVVQRKEGPLQVFLDPGVSSTSLTVPLARNTDAIVVYREDGEALGFMTLSNDNMNRPRKTSARMRPARTARQSKRKPKKAKGVVQYQDISGAQVKIPLTQDVEDIFPVLLPQSPGTAFALQAGNTLTMVAPGATLGSLRKPAKTTVFPGFFSAPQASALAIGAPLKGDDGKTTITYLDPMGGASSSAVITLSQPITPTPTPTATPTPVPTPIQDVCAYYLELRQQLAAAIRANNREEALRIAQLIVDLDYSNCEDPTPTPTDPTEDQDTIFTPDGVSYVTKVVRYGSNTGIAKGPCDVMLSGYDGTFNFVAKNSDAAVAIAYVLPEWGSFENGRVLDPKTFKVRFTARYDGVANGGRDHFRVLGKRLPIGAHIFAAEEWSGDTFCWKIPNGVTRVD